MRNDLLLIELYYSLLRNSSFSFYLKEKGYDVQLFAFFEKENERFISKLQLIKREFICVLKLLFKIRILRNRKIFCTGGYYALLFLHKFFKPLLGRSSEIYIFNFYLHAAGKSKVVQLILKFLFNNDQCTLIVQSPKEISYYKKIIPSLKITFVPYCSDPIFIQEEDRVQKIEGNYIFTGGYTNRDYQSVINCATKLPSELFVIAASSLNVELNKMSIPENVILFYDISNIEFECLLFYSQIVIVPLKDDVGSSGQMLSIRAMQNKKPIVYCDISSISYYFRENTGIPYSLNNENSMLSALTKLIENGSLRKYIGDNAYLYYAANFTNQHRNEQLYHIIKS